MKNGLYNVQFCVNLTDCSDEDEAKSIIAEMFQKMVDSVDFSDMTLELIEEEDEVSDEETAYVLREEDFEELSF